MSIPLKPDDPAYWMLQEGLNDPSKRSKRHVLPRDDCYICQDPEFELMGLPLCRACPYCSGHIPADDSICDDCGKDERDKEGEA